MSPAASRVDGLGRQRRGRGPLRHRPFRTLLVVMAVVGAVTSTIYTGTAARALAAGHPSYAGLADAGVALGSILGGLAWGRRRPSWSWGRSLTRLLTFLGAGLLLAATVGPYGLFAVALAAAGLAISPIFVVAYGASDTLVDPAEVTEAGTWVNTVTNLGVSFGGAASGLLVSQLGARAPVCAGAALAFGCVIAAACRRR
jgi:predicted MFS family arabinose efflux permease